MNKHFLLGAGLALVVTFSASSVFAQFMPQQATLLPTCAVGQSPKPGAGCIQQSGQSQEVLLPTCAAGQSPAMGAECIPAGLSDPMLQQPAQQQQPLQQNLQPSQPTQQATTPTKSDSGISDLKKILEDMKAEQAKEKADKDKEDLVKMFKEATQGNQQQPLFGQPQQSDGNKVDKSKLSSTKNPAVALAKKGLQNVDKLLSTLSKKFKKERNANKKLAVVRSVAKDFMKLCKKYTPDESDDGFGDEESFTCDEFVADLSEPIASALKSKDVDLAFESTYDALDINFRELFDSLIQQ